MRFSKAKQAGIIEESVSFDYNEGIKYAGVKFILANHSEQDEKIFFDKLSEFMKSYND